MGSAIGAIRYHLDTLVQIHETVGTKPFNIQDIPIPPNKRGPLIQKYKNMGYVVKIQSKSKDSNDRKTRSNLHPKWQLTSSVIQKMIDEGFAS